MTTIAFEDKALATDSLVTYDDKQHHHGVAASLDLGS